MRVLMTNIVLNIIPIFYEHFFPFQNFQAGWNAGNLFDFDY